MNAAIRTEVGPMVASGKKFDKPLDETLSCLMLVSEAVDVFRAVEPSIPSSYIAAFLAVAMDPGNGTVHYSKQLGMLQPVASRVLLEIGQKTRTGQPGLGLVAAEYDLHDLRLKRYYLTPKGHALIMRLEKAISRRRKGEARGD